jgi:hypothetical protein
MHALVAAAMKQSAVVWLSVDDRPGYPVWCLAIEDALYVVSGTGEQPAPGLDGATLAVVTARGDHGGRIASWPAEVTALDPGAEEWPPVAATLAGKRLNASGPIDETVERWRSGARIFRLVPASDEILPATEESHAAPPRPTPAATRAAKPFRLHRVKRR